MRYLAALFAPLLFAGTASAANLTCTVPPAAVARAVEMCEALRVSIPVNAANWSNDVCASEFLRRGLRDFDAKFTAAAARQIVKNNVSDTLATFDAAYPVAAVAAVCGDGTVDTEFGEVCDDGNRVSGDGCDENCEVE